MVEGNNLWNAVDLVARAGREIDSLVSELSIKMTEQFNKIGSDLNFNFEEGDPDVETVGDWIQISKIYQWGLKPKGRGKIVCGNLSVQVVLWTEEAGSDPCGKVPRVEVGYLGYSKDDKIHANSCGAGTWFTQDWWKEVFPKADEKYTNWPKSVKPCKGVSWNENASWVFAIPLFSVNSNDDIDRLIIEPAMKLLGGATPEIAFKGVTTIGFSIGQEGVLLSLPA